MDNMTYLELVSWIKGLWHDGYPELAHAIARYHRVTVSIY